MTAGAGLAWRAVAQGPRPVLIRRVRDDGMLEVSHKVGGHVLIGQSLQRKWSERSTPVDSCDLFPDYEAALGAVRALRRARQAGRSRK